MGRIEIDYDFAVRMKRDSLNQYIVSMFEISQNNNEDIKQIPFVFDTGATYTLVNKSVAKSSGWTVFKSGIVLGSYAKNSAVAVCDLRKIPRLAFGIKQTSELVVATPSDENVVVTNLLGRSFIDNFQYGIDQDAGKIYFKERNVEIDPNFSFSQILHSPVKR